MAKSLLFLQEHGIKDYEELVKITESMKEEIAGHKERISVLEEKLSANKVGRAMTDLGFRRMRSHGERGYVVVAYSADEVKARKRIKACDAKPDEAGAVDTFDAIDTIF